MFLKLLNHTAVQITLLIVTLVMTYIGIEELTENGVRSLIILFFVGIFNVLTIIAIHSKKLKTLVPVNKKIQLINFILTGLGLTLVIISYEYIAAATVAIFKRLDIAILTIISITAGSLSKKIIPLAIVFFTVSILMLDNKIIDEDITGYILVISGVVVLSISNHLKKKISGSEPIKSVLFIISLSTMSWAILIIYVMDIDVYTIEADLILLILGLSFLNMISLYIIFGLYKTYSVQFARYPLLLAAFLTMFAEMIVEQKWFDVEMIVGNSVIFLGLSWLVIISQKEEKQKKSLPPLN